MAEVSTAAVAAATGTPAVKGGKLVFMLNEPVEFNGEILIDITYRRPRGADMRKWLNASKGVGSDMQALMVDLTELPSAFFDAMDGADFMAFNNELQPFLRGVRKTSTT